MLNALKRVNTTPTHTVKMHYQYRHTLRYISKIKLLSLFMKRQWRIYIIDEYIRGRTQGSMYYLEKQSWNFPMAEWQEHDNKLPALYWHCKCKNVVRFDYLKII